MLQPVVFYFKNCGRVKGKKNNRFPRIRRFYASFEQKSRSKSSFFSSFKMRGSSPHKQKSFLTTWSVSLAILYRGVKKMSWQLNKRIQSSKKNNKKKVSILYKQTFKFIFTSCVQISIFCSVAGGHLQGVILTPLASKQVLLWRL